MLLERLDASRDLIDNGGRSSCRADHRGAVGSASTQRPLHQSLRRLGDVGAATLAGTPEAVRLAADPDERRLLISCADRFQELITDRIDDRLLHWDLHYFNTLSTLDGNSEWKAIDPKPLSGESGFELLPALVEPLGRSGRDRRPLRGPCCAVSTS